MKVTYRICALALISLSCLTVPSYAVDALDESGLDELHLEGWTRLPRPLPNGGERQRDEAVD
ncbi:MAG: hypothetical protein IPM37_06390 [Hahellaceae bacterium]|nr:hypothetical protein [Hahellaceae bacterium]